MDSESPFEEEFNWEISITTKYGKRFPVYITYSRTAAEEYVMGMIPFPAHVALVTIEKLPPFER